MVTITLIILFIAIYFFKEDFVDEQFYVKKYLQNHYYHVERFDTKGLGIMMVFVERRWWCHQICFNVRDDTDNFSELTGQGDWSKSRKGKTHCMCLGVKHIKQDNKGLILI